MESISKGDIELLNNYLNIIQRIRITDIKLADKSLDMIQVTGTRSIKPSNHVYQRIYSICN